MTVYPQELDNDSTIQRIDDNLSELGSEVINQCRSALFAIEMELGITPSGSKDSVADRLDVSLNSNGTIKASALTSIGLVTLPIDNAQVGASAGIIESKLTLDYSTSSLNTLIQANSTLLTSLSAFATATDTTLNSHIGGSAVSNLRHVASHIDLNAVPNDIRDNTYNWTGLLDKDGNLRSATTVAEGLLQINDALTTHQNEVDTAHEASAIGVDTSNFIELSTASTNLQEVLDNIDDIEELNLGSHRAVQHVSGVPKDARSISFVNSDGYSSAVVNSSPATAHVIHSPPGTIPLDSVSVGDNLVIFNPNNANFLFDAQFSQVRIGDIIRINYGNGLEDIRLVDSIRFTPGIEWVVRINGTNLIDTDGYTASARIDRPLYDTNTYGVAAVATANATPLTYFSNILGSVIVGDPRGACAVGIDFNASQINETRFNLYLELYPTGNPTDHVIALPAVDVSGNGGISPGSYTLNNVVQNINNKFREIGYNFRFIAFAVDGNIGIMMSDSIDGASFAIISGTNNNGTLIPGSYTANVVGNSGSDNFDALGFGVDKADLAGPAYIGTFSDSTSALLPTKIIYPLKRRNYIVNGKVYDSFKNKNGSTVDANGYGYFPAEIIGRTVTGTTVEVTYTVSGLLKDIGLKIGKTIVVQPSVDYNDGYYSDHDYGRFIIKEAFFSNCACDSETTTITVINGIHGTGSGVDSSASTGLAVRLYIGEDSVSFNDGNLIDSFPTSINYHRNFEIYLADNKTTFSHERARLPIQSETTDLLGTTSWHINSVSPKLSGYKDTSSSDLNKYIRFYVLSYDSTSGEYDGYIGKRFVSLNSIEKYGPVITGRKNVSTRFYDETYIDYVDLEFAESSPTDPGLLILSSSAHRYVDIELFPSLSEDDEILKLATCEVNWEPSAGTNIVERIVDCRQRGSISEMEFTTSAVDFITSVPRSLNENGVIRGFDFVGENANVNNELFFNGGSALINGKILTINNGSCVIPQITNTSLPPQIVDWLVCLNSLGNFVCIPQTPLKDQFFARNNVTPGTNYYIPSLTFSELDARKDLCLIAVVEATINSISVDVRDARKFVENQSENIPFTWISDTDNKNIGNFRSYESLRVWLENFGNKKSHIKIRGDFTYSSVLDFSGLDYELVLEGENATFNFTSFMGFKLGSNTTVKNITFNYNTLSVGFGIINNGVGSCIYVNLYDTSFAKNIYIDNCKFISESSDRPPFIGVDLINETYIDNLHITNCSFSDSSFINGSAIAIVNNFVGSGQIYSAIISNVSIAGNTCDGYQNISLVSESAAPGLFVSNVTVENNSCGFILYSTDSGSKVHPDIKGLYNSGLTIHNNNCIAIAGPTYSNGEVSSSSFTESSGDVVISNNHCAYIKSYVTQTSTKYGALKIINNSLRAVEHIRYMVDIINDSSVPNGIYVDGNNITDADVVIISNNVIHKNEIHTQAYNNGIFSWVSANILGNIIRNFSDYGVYLKSNSNVNNNYIYREGTSITAYVGGTSDYADITGNFFDDRTINGTDGYVVSIPNNSYWVAERNKNQVFPCIIGGALGIITSDIIAIGSGSNSGDLATEVSKVTVTRNPYVNLDASSAAIIIQTDTFAPHDIRWSISLKDILPKGVKILNVSTTVSSSYSSAGGSLILSLDRKTITNISFNDSTSASITSILPATKLLIDVSSGNFYNYSSDILHVVSINTSVPAGFDAGYLYFGNIIVTYTW